jgi:predicted membrane-bound dolichyl-phosphate-mannose-protein mannosyltransferase
VLVLVRLLAIAGTAAMASAIVAGFATASFTAEGGELVELAWGRVTLLDIYLAFVFGWLWIAWRERSAPRALGWLVATLVTGSFALFAYLLGASHRADDLTELVVGPHRRDELGVAPGPMASGR